MEELYKNLVEPDLIDNRDHQFCDIHGEHSLECIEDTRAQTKKVDVSTVEIKKTVQQQLKMKVDLRTHINSPIIQQGLLNSCSACALAIAVEAKFKRENKDFINDGVQTTNASQMFIYYNERVIEGKVDINAPVFIRNGIKSLFNKGICSDQLWPYPKDALPEYVIAAMNTGTSNEVQQAVGKAIKQHQNEIQIVISERPSPSAIAQAKKHRISRYASLSIENGLDELKHALSKGLPFIFGMMVPVGFFITPETGLMTMPTSETKRLGGHAMIAVGFDEEHQHFIVRNSYGVDFGDSGYCYIPYEFFTGSYQQNGKELKNTFSFWCLL